MNFCDSQIMTHLPGRIVDLFWTWHDLVDKILYLACYKLRSQRSKFSKIQKSNMDDRLDYTM